MDCMQIGFEPFSATIGIVRTLGVFEGLMNLLHPKILHGSGNGFALIVIAVIVITITESGKQVGIPSLGGRSALGIQIEKIGKEWIRNVFVSIWSITILAISQILDLTPNVQVLCVQIKFQYGQGIWNASAKKQGSKELVPIVQRLYTLDHEGTVAYFDMLGIIQKVRVLAQKAFYGRIRKVLVAVVIAVLFVCFCFFLFQ
mmetsp:Transcript_33474/g.81060  ORF Transcript_33474/g.81060 Transcript_33474/m.81060 type:complete len:201 (+) Transcript_33474:561-1163(+)